MIRPLRLRWLDAAEMDRVHADSLAVLWEDGIHIKHAGARALLADAGALTDGAAGMVRLPPDLVERALAAAPREFLLAGRTPDKDLVIRPDARPYTRSVGGNEGYNDLNTGEYRLGTCADIVEFTRLFDGLAHLDICCGLLPCDAPIKARDLTTMKTMLANTVKHASISVDDIDQFRAMIEMAAVIQGGSDELKRRPLFSNLTSTTSPRALAYYCLDNILLAGRHGIPIMLNASPLMGATGPVTIAGILVQCNLEILALLTVSQLATPGAPVIYRHLPMTVDMATGNPVAASMECVMATGALTQMVRERYGLPTDVFGTITDTVVRDGQAQIERNTLALMSALSGAAIVAGAGELGDGSSLDPVQLVIDNDIFANLQRCLAGFAVDEETCARDLIKRVRPGMEYLSEEHTLTHFRREHRRTEVFVRQTREEWLAAGSQDLAGRARERARRILSEHAPPPLPAEVQVELERIYQHHLKACGAV